MMRLVLLPVCFLFLLPAYTSAQDSTRFRLTTGDAGVLKDVGPMRVGVEELPPEFESFGLHKDDIQRDVELKLRLAGMTIDNDVSPYLYVVLGGLCSSGACSYSISIYYREPMFSLRNEGLIIVLDAISWGPVGGNGVVGSSNLRSVRDFVKDKVDEFINAYLTANPKRQP